MDTTLISVIQLETLALQCPILKQGQASKSKNGLQKFSLIETQIQKQKQLSERNLVEIQTNFQAKIKKLNISGKKNKGSMNFEWNTTNREYANSKIDLLKIMIEILKNK